MILPAPNGANETNLGRRKGTVGAPAIIATVSAALTAAFVLALFLWAARKDGQYDRETQRRLGIRRRTRL